MTVFEKRVAGPVANVKAASSTVVRAISSNCCAWIGFEIKAGTAPDPSKSNASRQRPKLNLGIALLCRRFQFGKPDSHFKKFARMCGIYRKVVLFHRIGLQIK